jgi:hypothetical protein
MLLKRGPEESHEERQGSLCPDPDSIPSPPEYKSEVLRLLQYIHLHCSLFRVFASLNWHPIMM